MKNENTVTVSYVAPDNGDKACLLVCVKHGDAMIVINSFYGTEAEQLYWKLTGLEGPFNTVAISSAPPEKQWLRDLLRRPREQEGWSPFVITLKETAEEPESVKPDNPKVEDTFW